MRLNGRKQKTVERIGGESSISLIVSPKVPKFQFDILEL